MLLSSVQVLLNVLRPQRAAALNSMLHCLLCSSGLLMCGLIFIAPRKLPLLIQRCLAAVQLCSAHVLLDVYRPQQAAALHSILPGCYAALVCPGNVPRPQERVALDSVLPDCRAALVRSGVAGWHL